MIRWRRGVVTVLERRWNGSLELRARIDDGQPDAGAEVQALAYPALVGEPQVGDAVLLNVTALQLDLGTGGYALVAALPDRLPPDRPAGPGHLVKARYTPLQSTVLGVDEQDSPWHATLREADSLDSVPVVTADLHSALPAIIAGARTAATPPRVVYVMTDGGALPVWFSRTVAGLLEAGWVADVVSVGQSFGGSVEAVTLHSGLLAAVHALDAEIVIVSQGPGNLGTGTRWGFSGVACGEAINAAAVLGGTPIASLRVSEADARERHYGVSHHSLTAYGRVALAPAEVVVPRLGGDLGERVEAQVAPLGQRHRLVREPVDGLDEALAASPVRLSTMGRGLNADRAAFVSAAAAGRYAARSLTATS